MPARTWRPWDDEAPKRRGMPPLPLVGYEGPPCSDYAFWSPRVRTNDIGNFDGVTFCTSNEMNHDFSCYKPRPEPTP